ncbi:MAG TPA: hypothetical protein VMU25_00675 [Candidatus Paceibacterota bacterium]|nr:hypothetical protein [Candidatus Paceibacterota bacterium]
MSRISRRGILATALCAPALILTTRFGVSEPMFAGVPEGLAPGDFGYKHEMYHESYQKVFGALGRCSCGTGDCRVTNWRETQLGSEKGFDVIVKRQWWPLPGNVWMPGANDSHVIPVELYNEWAHICAYETTVFNQSLGLKTQVIACAMINKKQA